MEKKSAAKILTLECPWPLEPVTLIAFPTVMVCRAETVYCEQFARWLKLLYSLASWGTSSTSYSRELMIITRGPLRPPVHVSR